MVTIILKFHSINSSVQIGDIAYYCDLNTLGRDQIAEKEDIIELGYIKEIEGNSIHVLSDAGITPPTTNSFVFFSKDNTVNLSGIKGYFSNIEIRNNSTEKAEMYDVGCDIFESSK